MSTTTKQRLSVGAVLIGLLGFGVLCFMWSTMPPPEAHADVGLTTGAAAGVVGVVEARVSSAEPSDEQAFSLLNGAFESLRHRVDAGLRGEGGVGGDPAKLEAVLGGYDALIDHTRRLAESPGTSAGVGAKAYRLLHVLYERQGRHEQARAAYGRHLDKVAAHRGRKLAGLTVRAAVRRALTRRDLAGARAKAELYVDKFADDPVETARALSVLTKVAWEQGSYEEVSGFAGLIIGQYSESHHVAEALRDKARAEYFQHNYAAAEAALKELERRYPNTKYPAFALALRGNMYLTRERAMEAAACYTLMLERYPTCRYVEDVTKRLAQAKAQAEQELLDKVQEDRVKARAEWDKRLSRAKQRMAETWPLVASVDVAGRTAQ